MDDMRHTITGRFLAAYVGCVLLTAAAVFYGTLRLFDRFLGGN